MDMLRRVMIKGYKSIKAVDLELRPLNVLIGANGAGKSNLIAFFKMLSEMMGGRLQDYLATAGRAHSLLHYGPKVTPQLEARLEFDVANGLDSYELRLFHAAGDTLVFAEETLSFQQSGWVGNPKVLSLGAGHEETRIVGEANRGEPTAKVFRYLLNNCRVYHFHDTSATARVRHYGYIADNRPLLPDAGNLAAFLYRLKNLDQSASYQRIVSTIRMIAPFFQDFELEAASPNARDITLNWREKESDLVFGPHQLSDGTLRVICLVTLLLQPESELPRLIVVDEPELGLHPYALNVVASLFEMASHHSQVLISTQSSSFLDNFDANDIIVVGRTGKESVFSRPDRSSLDSWLEEYSLGEVWEKNVIGGGPH
jgi:predicted ATPase